MSMSKEAAAVSKMSEMTGLEYIWESQATYADILFCFRQCHDLCEQSGLYSKELILQIDQCGVDFRQLSLDSVTVAKRVSAQWLDVAITFFENIDDVENPEQMLNLLGSQARELAECFKVIAAWARDISGRFHKAQDGTVREAEEFKRRFSAAQERAEKARNEMQANLDRAEKLRKKAADTEGSWRTASIFASWDPVGLVVTSVGRSFAEKATAQARKLEDEAHEELSKAAAELKQKADANAKAKFVASKAAGLVEALGNLETICQAIATFWTIEAEKFDAQGAKMKKSVVVIKGQVVKDTALWTKAKDEMDRYADAMSVINNCFNFPTEAKLPAAQSFSLPNLDLILHVPSSVNIKAITGR